MVMVLFYQHDIIAMADCPLMEQFLIWHFARD